MAGKNKKNAAEDLIESLMRDLKLDEAPIELSEGNAQPEKIESDSLELDNLDLGNLDLGSLDSVDQPAEIPELNDESLSPSSLIGLIDEDRLNIKPSVNRNEATVVGEALPSAHEATKIESIPNLEDGSDATIPLHLVKEEFPLKEQLKEDELIINQALTAREKVEVSETSEKTVAVTGFHQRKADDFQDKVRVSVGQNKSSAHSSGYAAWGGSNVDVNLAQAENLRIAQDKIIQLEKENEKLRLQNEELISASEIIKERSDLISAQLVELKNDREDLEQSYRNEIALLKGHIQRKEADLERVMMKNEELDSRLKFDMKKIRIRERELENRLELIRAEKNAIVKTKDDQILDLRRKMDMLQMEVDSYRQKCVELNKTIETNQESFKRTVRALRLAMANLELTEENKTPIKKAE